MDFQVTWWSLHIIIGLLFLALGFYYVSIKEKKDGLTSEDMEKLFTMGSVMSYIMILLGVLMVFYHGHLMYYQK